MKKLLARIRMLLRNRKLRKFWTRSVSTVAAIVVFVTTYALVLPAITMESEAACGKQAHQHTASCYEKQLICQLQESDSHHHTDSCYEKVLVCGMEPHIHSTECYKKDSSAVAATGLTSAGAQILESAGAESRIGETAGEESRFGEDAFGSAAEASGTADAVSADPAELDPQNMNDPAALENAGNQTDGTETDFAEDTSDGTEADFAEAPADGSETDFAENTADGAETDFVEDTSDGTEIDTAAENEEAPADGSETDFAEDPADGTENDAAADENAENPAGGSETDFAEDAADGSGTDFAEDTSDRTDADNVGSPTDDSETAGTQAPAADPSEDPSQNAAGQEESAAAGTTDVLPEELAEKEESLSDGYVPQLEELYFPALLTEETGFYYYHIGEEDEIPGTSSDITEWKKVNDDTQLAPTDLVKAWLSYTIPAGALNETNQIARYRLPANLHLTDDQILAINSAENGIALQADRSTEDGENEYLKYLGAEAIEGTRTPDQDLIEGTQEYISAAVKAENIYENTLDENGNYVAPDGSAAPDQGACIGQDLIFIFSPYTIEKNQITYDKKGKPVTKGEAVRGWFVMDFNMEQIDWVEEETDHAALTEDAAADLTGTPTEGAIDFAEEEETASDRFSEKKADIVFVQEDELQKIHEIRRELKLVDGEKDPAEIAPETDENAGEAATDAETAAQGLTNEEGAAEASTEEKAAEDATSPADGAEAADAGTTAQDDPAAEDKDPEAAQKEDTADTASTAESEEEEKTAPTTVTAKGTETTDKTAAARKAGAEKTVADGKISMPAQNFEGTVLVRTGRSSEGNPEAARQEAADPEADTSGETRNQNDGTSGDTQNQSESIPEGIQVQGDGIPESDKDHEPETTAVDNDSLPGKTTLTVRVQADEGTFPEGTTMVVTALEGNDLDAVASAVEENVSARTRGFQAVDITFRDKDGKEIEPVKPVRVTFTTDMISTAAGADYASAQPVILHIDQNGSAEQVEQKDTRLTNIVSPADRENSVTARMEATGDMSQFEQQDEDTADKDETAETEKPEKTDTTETTDKAEEKTEKTDKADASDAAASPSDASAEAVTIEADSFSTYAIVYTVDFRYGEYAYSIPGESALYLSDLFDELSIAEDVRDIDHVTFTDTSLVSVKKVAGSDAPNGQVDWKLQSLEPFTSDEVLTVYFKDGHAIVVNVTDAQIGGTGVNRNTADTASLGLEISLFNYGPDDKLDTTTNIWENRNNPYKETGINKGHSLKFYGYGSSGTTANNYTGGSTAMQGIVQPLLGSDGYPVLTNGVSQSLSGKTNESLNYLFNGQTGNGVEAVYTGLNHLFLTETSNAGNITYNYNSNKNYAYLENYNSGGKDFKVYNGTYTEEGSDYGIGFFPFNDYDSNYNCIHGKNFNWHNQWQNSKQGHYDHHFGMKMSGNFQLPESNNGEDVIYKFSGDDDMWLYIDGVLVLDIGGIHNEVEGIINFTKGTVKINSAHSAQAVDGADPSVTVGTDNTLENIFRKAGKTWDGGPLSTHKIDVFYMERGGCYSNLEISFNLPLTKTNGKLEFTKISSDSATTKLAGAQFGLFSDADCTKPLTSEGVAVTMTTEDPTGKATAENLAPGTYYLKETFAPDGYILSEDVYTVTIGKDGKATITKDGQTLTDIENEPEPKLQVNVQKAWEPGVEHDNVTSITYTLYKNGEIYHADGLTNPMKVVKGSEGADTFPASFSNLPRTDEEGEEIIWSVKETELTYRDGDIERTVKGNRISSVYTVRGDDGKPIEFNADHVGTATIKNYSHDHYEDTTIDLELEKLWKTQSGTIPSNASATFELRRYVHTETWKEASAEDKTGGNTTTITIKNENGDILDQVHNVVVGTHARVATNFKPWQAPFGAEFTYTDGGTSHTVIVRGESDENTLYMESEPFTVVHGADTNDGMVLTIPASEWQRLVDDGNGAARIILGVSTQAQEDTDFNASGNPGQDNANADHIERIVTLTGSDPTAWIHNFKDLPLEKFDKDENTNVVTKTVYGYYIVETSCTPEGYHWFYKTIGGSEENRIYYDGRKVEIENTDHKSFRVEKRWYRLSKEQMPPVVVRVTDNNQNIPVKDDAYADNGEVVHYNESIQGYVLDEGNEWNMNFYTLDDNVTYSYQEIGYLSGGTVHPFNSTFENKHYYYSATNTPPDERTRSKLLTSITTNGYQHRGNNGTMFIYNVPKSVNVPLEFKKKWYSFNGDNGAAPLINYDEGTSFTVQIQQKATWADAGTGHNAGELASDWTDYREPFTVYIRSDNAVEQGFEAVAHNENWLTNMSEYNFAASGFIENDATGEYELVNYDYTFKEISVQSGNDNRTWTRGAVGQDSEDGNNRQDLENYETGPLTIRKQWDLKSSNDRADKVYIRITGTSQAMRNVAEYIYQDEDPAYYGITSVDDQIAMINGEYVFVLSANQASGNAGGSSSAANEWVLELKNLDLFVNAANGDFTSAAYTAEEIGYVKGGTTVLAANAGDNYEYQTAYYRNARSEGESLTGAGEGGLPLDSSGRPASYYRIVNSNKPTDKLTVTKQWAAGDGSVAANDYPSDETMKVVLTLQERWHNVEWNESQGKYVEKDDWATDWQTASTGSSSAITLPLPKPAEGDAASMTEEDWRKTSAAWTYTFDNLAQYKELEGSTEESPKQARIYYRVIETSMPSGSSGNYKWYDPVISTTEQGGSSASGTAEVPGHDGSQNNDSSMPGAYEEKDAKDNDILNYQETLSNNPSVYTIDIEKMWERNGQKLNEWPDEYTVDYEVVRHSYLVSAEENGRRLLTDINRITYSYDTDKEVETKKLNDDLGITAGTGTLTAVNSSVHLNNIPKAGLWTADTTDSALGTEAGTTYVVKYIYEIKETAVGKPTESYYVSPDESVTVNENLQEGANGQLSNQMIDLTVDKKWKMDGAESGNDWPEGLVVDYKIQRTAKIIHDDTLEGTVVETRDVYSTYATGLAPAYGGPEIIADGQLKSGHNSHTWTDMTVNGIWTAPSNAEDIPEALTALGIKPGDSFHVEYSYKAVEKTGRATTHPAGGNGELYEFTGTSADAEPVTDGDAQTLKATLENDYKKLVIEKKWTKNGSTDGAEWPDGFEIAYKVRQTAKYKGKVVKTNDSFFVSNNKNANLTKNAQQYVLSPLPVKGILSGSGFDALTPAEKTALGIIDTKSYEVEYSYDVFEDPDHCTPAGSDPSSTYVFDAVKATMEIVADGEDAGAALATLTNDYTDITIEKKWFRDKVDGEEWKEGTDENTDDSTDSTKTWPDGYTVAFDVIRTAKITGTSKIIDEKSGIVYSGTLTSNNRTSTVSNLATKGSFTTGTELTNAQQSMGLLPSTTYPLTYTYTVKENETGSTADMNSLYVFNESEFPVGEDGTATIKNVLTDVSVHKEWDNEAIADENKEVTITSDITDDFSATAELYRSTVAPEIVEAKTFTVNLDVNWVYEGTTAEAPVQNDSVFHGVIKDNSGNEVYQFDLSAPAFKLEGIELEKEKAPYSVSIEKTSGEKVKSITEHGILDESNNILVLQAIVVKEEPLYYPLQVSVSRFENTQGEPTTEPDTGSVIVRIYKDGVQVGQDVELQNGNWTKTINDLLEVGENYTIEASKNGDVISSVVVSNTSSASTTVTSNDCEQKEVSFTVIVDDTEPAVPDDCFRFKVNVDWYALYKRDDTSTTCDVLTVPGAGNKLTVTLKSNGNEIGKLDVNPQKWSGYVDIEKSKIEGSGGYNVEYSSSGDDIINITDLNNTSYYTGNGNQTVSLTGYADFRLAKKTSLRVNLASVSSGANTWNFQIGDGVNGNIRLQTQKTFDNNSSNYIDIQDVPVSKDGNNLQYSINVYNSQIDGSAVSYTYTVNPQSAGSGGNGSPITFKAVDEPITININLGDGGRLLGENTTGSRQLYKDQMQSTNFINRKGWSKEKHNVATASYIQNGADKYVYSDHQVQSLRSVPSRLPLRAAGENDNTPVINVTSGTDPMFELPADAVANGPIDTQELSSTNEWNYVWENLPKYDADGNELFYYVVEKGSKTGDFTVVSSTGSSTYSVKSIESSYTYQYVDGDPEKGIASVNVKNKINLIEHFGNLKVLKQVEGVNGNVDKTFKFRVYRLINDASQNEPEKQWLKSENTEETTEERFTTNEAQAMVFEVSTQSSKTLYHLPVGTYYVEEVKGTNNSEIAIERYSFVEAGSRTAVEVGLPEAGATAILVNRYEVEKTELSGTKTWNDLDPAKLHENANDIKIVVKHRVKGSEVDWSEIDPLQEGKDYQLEWVENTYHIRNLNKFNPENVGEEYEFYVEEELDESIESEYITAVDASNEKNFINTELTNLEVSKIWVDKDGNDLGDGFWPEEVESVEFTLYRTVEGGTEEIVTAEMITGIEPVKMITDNDRKASWNKLPVWILDGAEWKKVAYSAKETEVKMTQGGGSTLNELAAIEEKYGAVYEQNEDGNTITNRIETVELSGEKLWVDEIAYNKDQESDPVTGQAPGNAGGSSGLQTDSEDQPGHTAPTLKLSRKSSDDSDFTDVSNLFTPEWSENVDAYTYSDLPKYDEQGKLYTYKVEEQKLEGYESAQDGNNFTNTELTSVKVQKKWKQVNSLIDPENASIIVTLNEVTKGDDGKETLTKVTGIANNGVTLDGKTKANGKDSTDELEITAWEYEWKDLPKYRYNPETEKVEQIIYKVSESDVKYGGEEIPAVDPVGLEEEYRMTNTLPTVEVEAQKTWDGKAGVDNWPDDKLSVMMKLQQKVSDGEWSDVPVESLKASDTNTNPAEIKVIEVEVDEPEQGSDSGDGSSNSGTGDSAGSGDSSTPAQESGGTGGQSGSNEGDNGSGGAGGSGTAAMVRQLTEVRWTNLPKYDINGNKIEYKVVETGIRYDGETVENWGDKYEISDPEQETSGLTTTIFTIDNKPETLEMYGTKTWVDGNKTHDNASEITLKVSRRLKALENETPGSFEPFEVQTGDITWSGNNYTVKNLPRYAPSGREYEYRVEEEELEGYLSTTTTSDAHNTDPESPDYTGQLDYNFLNLEKTKVQAKKEWFDKDENHTLLTDDQIKEFSVEYRIQKRYEGETDNDWKYLRLTSGNGVSTFYTLPLKVYPENATEDSVPTLVWEETFDNLPAYELVETDDGNGNPTTEYKKIEYRVVETRVNGELVTEKEINDGNGSKVKVNKAGTWVTTMDHETGTTVWTMKNTLDDTTDFSFSKVWLDIFHETMPWPGNVSTITVLLSRQGTLEEHTDSEPADGTTPETKFFKDENIVTLEFGKDGLKYYTLKGGARTAYDSANTGVTDLFESISTAGDDEQYGFSINGLPLIAKMTADGKTYKGEWDYVIEELQLNDYQPPQYVDADNNKVPRGQNYVGSGGLVANEYAPIELPASGGSGTHMFYILGAMLTAAALVLLARRKKM